MVQRINKTEDIIDVLTGDVSLIKSVKYWTTDKEVFITPHIEYGEGTAICRLCSQDLDKLADGQLHSTVELESEDVEFCDEKYNTTIEEGLEVWIWQE